MGKLNPVQITLSIFFDLQPENVAVLLSRLSKKKFGHLAAKRLRYIL